MVKGNINREEEADGKYTTKGVKDRKVICTYDKSESKRG
jgi:hypothetical protein